MTSIERLLVRGRGGERSMLFLLLLSGGCAALYERVSPLRGGSSSQVLSRSRWRGRVWMVVRRSTSPSTKTSLAKVFQEEMWKQVHFVKTFQKMRPKKGPFRFFQDVSQEQRTSQGRSSR